jgi:L-arabinose isomerase
MVFGPFDIKKFTAFTTTFEKRQGLNHLHGTASRRHMPAGAVLACGKVESCGPVAPIKAMAAGRHILYGGLLLRHAPKRFR